MTVNLTNMLSTIALIGLLVGPTVGVADGSDAYQACQDMKWKADKQAKKNCFRDLALSYEVVMANGSTDTDTSELEDEIAELEGKLEESEEGIAEIEEAHEAEIAELEGKLEESEEGIAEIEEAHEAEIAELEGKLEESEAEIAELADKLEGEMGNNTFPSDLYEDEIARLNCALTFLEQQPPHVVPSIILPAMARQMEEGEWLSECPHWHLRRDDGFGAQRSRYWTE